MTSRLPLPQSLKSRTVPATPLFDALALILRQTTPGTSNASKNRSRLRPRAPTIQLSRVQFRPRAASPSAAVLPNKWRCRPPRPLMAVPHQNDCTLHLQIEQIAKFSNFQVGYSTHFMRQHLFLIGKNNNTAKTTSFPGSLSRSYVVYIYVQP